jgi:hypothetical protein
MNRRQFLSTASVLAGGESPSMRRGSQELERYLAGSDILSRITLRATEAFGPEGFRLKSDGRNILIEGGRQRGVMYGVYAFLEKLGFRWYAEDCTVTPRAWSVPVLDEVQRPAFEYREVFIKEASGKDWAARNRLNGGNTELDDSTGGKRIYYPFGHSFELLVPPHQYFAAHPEYFSLVGGQRRAVNSQLCLSNRDVLRIAINRVFHWIGEHPEAALLSVSQNDEDAWCECADCRRIEEEEGAHSGPIIRFVNAIAREVSRKHPGKLIDTFAYRYSEKPPGKVKAHPNVRVRIAPICACQAHPYQKCPHNRFVVDNLRGWARVTNQLYVWHYIVNFNQYLMPFPNLDELSEDLAMYHRNSVVGLFFQGGKSKGGGTELAELRAWLLAKLLWNPALDPRALIREFVNAYYGPAAPAMAEYLDVMHRDVRSGKSMFLYRAPAFSSEFRPAAGRCFDKMQAAAKGEYARRVDKARLAIEWFDLYQAKRAVLKDGRYGPADPAEYWRRYEALLKRARGYGYTDFCEWGPIELIESEDRRFVKSHATLTLENQRLRVVVVPTFHARIIRFIDKSRGIDAIRHTDPDERFSVLETLGGLVLYVHPEQFSRPRYDVAWEVEDSRDAARVVLRGVCENGLRLRRILALSPQGMRLHTATTVRNEGAAPLPVTLHSRAEINPGDLENPTVDFAYRRREGGDYRQRIFPPPGMPLGDLFLGGEGKPAGEWRLVNPGLGFSLINRFQPEDVDRCRLWWRGRRQGQANIGVWSRMRVLKPGECLELKTDYEVE